MNLLEIRTRAREILQDEDATNPAFSTTKLNVWINDGIRNACLMADAYMKTQTFPVITTIAGYVLPWDFLKPISVKNHLYKDLDPIAESVSGSVYIVTGKPTWYYVRHGPLIKTTRASLTIYYTGEFLIPVTANGYMYEVTTGGLSGAAIPTYPTSSGSTVADGACTLTCRELVTKMWSLVLVDTPTTLGGGIGTYTLTYSAMDEGLYTDTAAPNFPMEKHFGIVDYTCARALMSKRQYSDAMVFNMKYCSTFGLEIPNVSGGTQSA
jgi:hypothetical protein